jgi:hypothetical protein
MIVAHITHKIARRRGCKRELRPFRDGIPISDFIVTVLSPVAWSRWLLTIRQKHSSRGLQSNASLVSTQPVGSRSHDVVVCYFAVILATTIREAIHLKILGPLCTVSVVEAPGNVSEHRILKLAHNCTDLADLILVRRKRPLGKAKTSSFQPNLISHL